MTTEYSIGVNNRFALFYDNDDDPGDIIPAPTLKKDETSKSAKNKGVSKQQGTKGGNAKESKEKVLQQSNKKTTENGTKCEDQCGQVLCKLPLLHQKLSVFSITLLYSMITIKRLAFQFNLEPPCLLVWCRRLSVYIVYQWLVQPADLYQMQRLHLDLGGIPIVEITVGIEETAMTGPLEPQGEAANDCHQEKKTR